MVHETQWFTEMGAVDDKLFDFLGIKLSIRQFVYAVTFAIAALYTARYISHLGGGLLGVVVGLMFFTALSTIMIPRGRAIPPERYLVLLPLKKVLRRPQKPKPKRVKRVAQLTTTAEEGEPVRVVGVLYHPSTGKPLPNTRFEVRVEGKPYYKGKTDGSGRYGVVFFPSRSGAYELEIRPEGFTEGATERVRVSVGWAGVAPPPEEEVVEQAPVARSKGAGEYRYVYELIPSNFALLSDREREEVVGAFQHFLNSLEGGIRLDIVRDSKTVEVVGARIPMVLYRFFASSTTPLEPNLQLAGISYHRVWERPEPRVVRSMGRYVVLEGGRVVRPVMVYQLPNSMKVGWLAETYGAADWITVHISPIPPGDALKTMRKYRVRKEAEMVYYQNKQRSIPGGVRAEWEQAVRTEETLRGGGARLFRLSVNLGIGGEDLDAAKHNYAVIKSLLLGYGVKLDSPRFWKEEVLRGEIRAEAFAPTRTAATLYPFISSEVLEPGGVFLGENALTGAPVYYDFYARDNQACAVIGKMGAGKSYLVKALLTRLVERYPSAAFYVVDPEGEYGKVCEALGGTTVDVSPSRPLGLDPFKLFRENRAAVFDVLREILRVPEGESAMLSDLRELAMRCDTIKGLERVAPRSLKKLVHGLLRGPEGFLVTGSEVRFGERMCFNLRELHQALKLSGERTGAVHIAAMLIFTKIWNEIERLPLEQPKIVIIDEAWLYTSIPSSAAFLEYAARRSRKLNVFLFVISQRPADVLQSEAGRTVCENAATKFLLQQDETVIDLVKNRFGLTDEEARELPDFKTGRVLLMAKGIRAQVQVIATPSEHALFTTKPTEVARFRGEKRAAERYPKLTPDIRKAAESLMRAPKRRRGVKGGKR